MPGNEEINKNTVLHLCLKVPMIPEAQAVEGEAPSWWKGKGMAGFLRKKHRLLRSKTT